MAGSLGAADDRCYYLEPIPPQWESWPWGGQVLVLLGAGGAVGCTGGTGLP